MALIAERVEQARRGTNDRVICRLPAGWAVVGDVQFLPGYCLLLADPVVASLNDLDAVGRTRFLADMARLGDAILRVTKAERINYEILGNSEPELHAHLFPRYAPEPPHLRRMPAWFYDWDAAPGYDAETHGPLRDALRAQLISDAPCGPRVDDASAPTGTLTE